MSKHAKSQSRWVVYDSWEHEFSVYYDEQEARREYEARIKGINDDVGNNDEYDGDEEVYLCQVISKAEVVQVGIADDGNEGLYRLCAYDCTAHSAAGEAVLKELLDFIDNADNQFDKNTVHKLVDWVVSKGVIPDAR